MTTENNGSAPEQEVPVPDAIEVLTVPQALTGVIDAPNGQAIVFFQTVAGRRYQFVLDQNGRQAIGRKLTAPHVHIP